ncbi:ABC transporter permease [Halalkalibacter hemicellulosilyticus]|uniref:ABC transport system permease protein n=1 Tax=Halalkalibacter hemicellulosilyticusJCM 9152 TaxID=1236971 RepID=W4QIZ0_9BACI|nr:ABC transporter permease [Halalkalibacter hemicellulosilyticus]GAE32051.1 ABC transport system permease protein [Halalkalibacter hemicellulosilyticusJCM 9152]
MPVIENTTRSKQLLTTREKKSNISIRFSKFWDKDRISRMGTIIGFFVLWQIIGMLNVRAEWFNPVFLPTPINVMEAALHLHDRGVLIGHIWSSAWRLGLGFSLGVSIAVILAFLIVKFKVVQNIVDPLINMIGPIPPFALLPIFIIWMGVGDVSKLTLITYSTAIPMIAYTVDGIRNVNPLLIRSSLALGANQRQVFTKVILPSALPPIFVGMRVTLAISFSAMVVAEMIGSHSGLGYLIIDSRNFFQMSNMFLAAALIGALYFVFAFFLGLIEGKLFKWKKGTQISDAVQK